MALVLECLDDAGTWHRLPLGAESLADMLTCPICTEAYYTGEPTRLPHTTCRAGHTCCVECFERLPRQLLALTSCPSCRQTTPTAHLAVPAESGGLLGVLLRRRLRWACAACAHAGELVDVRAHAATCRRTVRPCPLCPSEQPRAALRAHLARAHAGLALPVGAAGATLGKGAHVLLLPLDCVVRVELLPCDTLAVAVLACAHTHDAMSASLELSVVHGGRCASVDLLALLRGGVAAATVPAVHAPFVVAGSVCVPLFVTPARSLLWLGGSKVAHLSGDALGESMLMPLRGGAPCRLGQHARVGLVPARPGARCWSRRGADGLLAVGTLVRFAGSDAIVRCDDGEVFCVDRALCGAMHEGP
jgi:hypothetical protein